jgi:hypothetical protein
VTTAPYVSVFVVVVVVVIIIIIIIKKFSNYVMRN